MRSVNRFEADLLRILHALMGRAPVEGVLPKIVARRERPRCLSRDAVALVQDSLAKGCVWQLALRGGWRRQRHVRGARVADGRLWERTEPSDLGLSFSRHALEFLLWLTAESPEDRGAQWAPPEDELRDGDRLLLFLAYEALRDTTSAVALRTMGPFARHGLCRLAFPEDFADNRVAHEPEMIPWVEEPGAFVLEALQPMLAARWMEVERRKGEINEPSRMRALGAEQERVLDALLPAVDAAGRRDLARFLLRAASGLLREGAPAREWVQGLRLEGLRVADRMETYRAALAFLRHLDRFRGWEREARAVGYFDDGYAASQLWKADWEAGGGEESLARAQAIIRELEPLGV